MNLRDLVQQLTLIPCEQDIQVSLRIGDAVSTISHVCARESAGKISIEIEAHKPPSRTVRSFVGRTIRDPAEIRAIIGAKNCIQTRAAA